MERREYIFFRNEKKKKKKRKNRSEERNRGLERFTPRGMRSTRFIAVYYLSRLPASRNNGSGRKLPLNTLGSVKPCNDARCIALEGRRRKPRGWWNVHVSRASFELRIPCVIFKRNRVSVARLSVTMRSREPCTSFFFFYRRYFIDQRREYYNINRLGC